MPLYDGTEAFKRAVLLGEQWHGIALLLMTHLSLNAAVVPEGELWVAARDGSLRDVERVLADGGVCPNAVTGTALRLAAENGHAAVEARLLADVHSRSYGLHQEPLDVAVRNGHAAVVSTLLAERRFDRIVKDCAAALRAAAAHAGEGTAAVLMVDCRVNPDTAANDALCAAAAAGDLDAVQSTLARPRVDAAIRASEPLRRAAQGGHWRVAARLLQEPRVRSDSWQDMRACIDAAAAGSAECVSVILDAAASLRT